MKISVPWIVGLTVLAMVIFVVMQDELGFWLCAGTLILGCLELFSKKG